MRVETLGDDSLLVVGDAEAYRLRVWPDARAAILDCRGESLADLELGSGLDTTDGPDTWNRLEAPRLRRLASGLTVTWQGCSERWPSKMVTLRAEPGGFSYGYAVEGCGAIARARYSHSHAARAALTTHANASVNHRLFSPQPNGARQTFFGPGERSVIPVFDTNDVPGSSWFFTPAPTCFALPLGGPEDGWLGLGVGAEQGQWRFTSFSANADGAGLALEYDGQTLVDGHWESPTILGLPVADPYAALDRYARELRDRGQTPTPIAVRQPDWWLEPIFCGWGEQFALEQLLPGTPAADFCTQANYTGWLTTLERHGLQPGTVVVDDRWQDAYGLNHPDLAKWPDLRGFVQQQHARGRRVLLWLKAWDAEGLPDRECLLHTDGQRRADPGNTFYAERLASTVRDLLGEVGADGFKLDFTASIPHGPGWMASAGGQWGLELLRQWLAIVADAARATRPDALLVAHTAHPLFADVVDALRLNDLPVWAPLHSPDELVAAMEHRARVARAAWPGWLLESDNWPVPDRATWRHYLAAQASGRLGVPSLYYAERIGMGQPVEHFSDADYAAVAEAWAAYRASLARGLP